MLKDRDRKRLRDGLSDLNAPLELVLCRDEGHPLDAPLALAAAQVAEASGGAITVREAVRDDLPATPAMVLSHRGRDNLRYLAVPHGPETPPFLDALLDLASGVVADDVAWVRPLVALEHPAELLVFVSPTCPHCPQAVRAALSIAVAQEKIRATVIDAEQFPALAAGFGARSVPLIVLDGEWAHVGVVPAETLAQRILARGTPEHEVAVLESMLEVGRTTVAGRDLAAGRRVRAFHELWKRSGTSERMGLMLTVETALELAPRCLDSIVGALAVMLGSKDTALRGDTADLLGQIGNGAAIEALVALLEGEQNPDVREIAEEAIEGLRG